MNAHVSFHGFSVPLIGIDRESVLNECDDCHDEFDTLQMRLTTDGHFRCDKCAKHDTKQYQLALTKSLA